MAKSYEMEGKIHLIDEVQEFKNNFTKREFVIETVDGQYTQHIKFELIKDNTSLVDDFSQGDPIKVHFDIRGNEYNGRFYVNLTAWRVEKPSGGTQQNDEDGPPSHMNEPPADLADGSKDEEVPF